MMCKGFIEGLVAIGGVKCTGDLAYPLYPSSLVIMFICVLQPRPFSFKVPQIYTPHTYDFGWDQKAQ
jgi:hypothetical protein